MIQKCIYCNNEEVPYIKFLEGDIIYHCDVCNKKYSQATAETYNMLTVWQKIFFRLHLLLKE